MVVRTEHIQQHVRAALALAVMIGDVGREIGAAPIRPDHHAVLLVAVFLRRKPQCAVASVGDVLQIFETGIDRSARDQFALGLPVVEPHAELLEVVANVFQYPIARQAADVCEQFVAQRPARGINQRVHESVDTLTIVLIGIRPGHPAPGRLGRFRQFVAHAPCQIKNVFPPVCAFREPRACVFPLHHPQPHRKPQHRQLPPGIVDVVLAPDLVPGSFQQAGQAVADGRVPPVPHVQGAGGIGGHEFHQHLAARAAAA